MSEKIHAQPGDTVELANKEGGFTDPMTGFDISRDQQVKLGDSVGALTQQAVLSGGLLIVGSSRKKRTAADDDGGADDGFDLPADLPGREAFVAAGITTFAAVKELDTEEKLLAVKGIGKGTVKAIAAWAAETEK